MSSYLKITSTNSTPKLKSSPVPILFISFNRSQIDCSHCGNKYSMTILFNQKYCKICFLKYIKDIKDIKDTSSDTYLDIRISKNDIQRSTQNIQEIFENDYKISYFKQIVSFHLRYEKQKLEESENCKLCGKLIPQQTYLFRICPYCYQISYEWIQSTFTNKYVPILYLPWWDNCSNCIILLTTNIIFGIPDQSQCRKCKRKSSITIDITIINSGNIIIEKFFASTREEINQKIASNLNNHIIDKNSNPIEIYNFFFKYKSDYFSLKPLIEWIPYSQITKLEKTAAGGFSIIYKATCLFRKYNSMKYFKTVAIKRYLNTQDMEKYFLNELNSLYRYHKNGRIISCFGVTQDPDTKEYMCNVQFNKAEEKRLELIKLKKLGPDFTEKFHSDATYTSRISSNNSLFEYITKEYDYDINTQSQQSTTHITNVQDFPTKNSSRKRHMEELRIETQYDRKRIKA
ncbi:unnamed protein product [Rhizophagus irregularis]|nr:unnamed protein product [Rhizophagus irregularis]